MAEYPSVGDPGTWGTGLRAFAAVTTDLSTGKIINEALQTTSDPPIADEALVNKKFVDDTKGFPGTSITGQAVIAASWTEIDLSTIVGTNAAFCVLLIANSGSSANVYLKTKGETIDNPDTPNNAGYGASAGYSLTGKHIYLVAVTDDSGVIEARSLGGSPTLALKVVYYAKK